MDGMKAWLDAMKDEASRTADAAADMVVVADFIRIETPRQGWWLRLVLLFEIWDGYMY